MLIKPQTPWLLANIKIMYTQTKTAYNHPIQVEGYAEDSQRHNLPMEIGL
jgi:hypothetical protein